jgi:hypothetical protein
MKTIRDLFMAALCLVFIALGNWLLDMNYYPQG